jgi:hypothetical protein
LADGLDVFFSYAARDHGAVKWIAGALRDQGLLIFLDRWYLTPGQPWPQVLEEALAACNAVAVFIGAEGFGPWQQRERDMALDRQGREPGFPVIPVLLARADPALGFLKLNTWVDLSKEPTNAEALAVLAAAIRREPPGPQVQARSEAVRALVCPYRGLQAFREEDEPFFFGRAAFSEKLTASVLDHPLVAVVGASGSGKSSLVRAGLIPRLRRGAGNRVWDTITLVPTDQRLKSLAAALLPRLEPDVSAVDRLAEVNKLAKHLADGSIALRDAAAHVLERQPGTERLLLFVDQGEELYTLSPDSDAGATFIGQMLTAAASDAVRVVLTLRGDFMGRALENRELSDRLQDGVVTVGPMTEDELKETIVEPAVKVGLHFEEGLAETILTDVGREPGGLPLLEFLLEGLWRERRNGLLTLDAYGRLGRVAGAIARRAEDVFQNDLTEAERQAAPKLLTRLIRPGEGMGGTRRRAELSQTDAVTTGTIHKLATARLVVTEGAASSKTMTVELAHEALIREWTRLRIWIKEDQDFLRTRERIATQAQLWKEEKCPIERLLPPGRPLAEGRDLLTTRKDDLEPELVKYVKTSIAAEEEKLAAERIKNEAERESEQRRTRIERRKAVAITILAIIAFTVGSLAWWLQRLAERNAEAAQIN